MLGWMSLDGRLLLAARALRTFGYGYLAVVLGVYLAALGLDALRVGIVVSVTIAGSAATTVFWSFAADRFGRRRTVRLMALVMVASGLAFTLATELWLLLLAAASGTISATSSEVGPFQTVEQAALPQTAPPGRRTLLFSLYNLVGNFAAAVGALAVGTVSVFAGLGLAGPDAYRPLFLLYALLGAANFVLFLRLSEHVELARIEGARRFLGIHRSAGAVTGLAALFALDAFAGGFVVHSIVAYWFALRWDLSPEALGVLFFWVGLLSGLSLLAASWLAQRIGLLNTMVFTHLPSNVLLMLVPLAPSAPLAVALFLGRMAISQMDVPTRQSYVMTVVDADERTATAGITNVARAVASSISPTFAGLAIGAAAFGTPFFAAGGLKIVYDLALYAAFRARPLREKAAAS